MKKLIIMGLMASISLMGCKKDTATTVPTVPPETTTLNKFTVGAFGDFTAPQGSGTYGGVVTANTSYLAFAFISKTNADGSNRGGGNIAFPLGATSGTYNVKPEPAGGGFSLGAGECNVDISCNPPRYGC